ncbi:MAG: hypothetical protein ACLQU1_32080 [Bryobacteraceae bacterium]
MDQVTLQGQVLELLQRFSGTEPLKDLFWSKLNYDRKNEPTSRRKWPEAAAAAVADDPTLLAAGGADGDFHVLYARLAKDRLSLADERTVTSRLLKDHPLTNWKKVSCPPEDLPSAIGR